MAIEDLSEEEVFANDIDPLDAIRQIRKEEGVPEEDLISKDDSITSSPESSDAEEEEETDDLKSFEEDEAEGDIEKEDEVSKEESKKEDATDTEDQEDKEKSEETEEEESEEEEKQPEKYKFKANGQEFEFTQEEILEQFEVVFGKAMDYTNKTKKMAPYRKMISALESEGINSDQLNLAIDALKGNKEAIQELIRINEIDAYEISNSNNNENTPYTPKEYGKDDIQLDIREITEVISKDPEYKITVDVVDRQWDDKSRQVLASNPGMIQGLHNDIKKGIYDKVAPLAMKMKVLDGNTKSDLEYYILAGEQVLGSEKQNSEAEQSVAEKNREAQDADNNFDQASSEARRKRSASPTRKRADSKSVIDYLDDDDEKFDAWYSNLMASQ